MEDRHYYMKPGDVLVVHQDLSAQASAANLEVLNDNQFKLIKDLRAALGKLEGQIKDLKEEAWRQARVIAAHEDNGRVYYLACGASVFSLRNNKLMYYATKASASGAAVFADELNEGDG